MIIRDVEKAKFDFINHSDAMSLRIIYNGQCAKPPDPLVEFINMILSSALRCLC